MEIQLPSTLSYPSQSLRYCIVSRFLNFNNRSLDFLAPHRKGTVTWSVNSEGLMNSSTRSFVGPQAAVMWAAQKYIFSVHSEFVLLVI